MPIYEDNTLTIGNTPLVRLNRITDGNVYAKIESRNPATSVKCRIGANMVWDAEKRGVLKPGMTIVEPTSGNTGIALGYVAAARGYKLKLTMPSSFSLERRKVMKALGAELILTDPKKGINGAIAAAQEIVDSAPESHLMLQQFENPANPEIHEKTTGPEIWQDTNGQVDVIIAGVGTGGTITGISRYIKNTQNKAITSIAVEPTDSTSISNTLKGEAIQHSPHKIQGIGAGFVPKNLDLSLIDKVELVSNEDAIKYAHLLMKEEGILAGISSGAAVAAAVRVAKQEEFKDKMIVVILPDSAERYLSTALFEDVFTGQENTQ
ncbi:MAG: cysteine synthase A [Pseudomonadales bacterium]|nr:cysteine synthase A [Pseudomonadales bacterium]